MCLFPRLFFGLERDNIFSHTFATKQNVRIYRYYRDLVGFRHKGDPGLLLRCINPQEAALVADRYVCMLNLSASPTHRPTAVLLATKQ